MNTPDPADAVPEFTEDLAGGAVTISLDPIRGGKVRLAAHHNDDVLESGEYTRKIFGSQTLRGQFLNSVEESLEATNGIDAADVRRELKEWFAEMNQRGKEQEKELLLPDHVQQIIDGTQYPVEVYDGEPTTWHVTLTFAGRTRDLEFTVGEMVNGGAGALEEKIANQFFELVDIEQADWEAIRDRWQEHSTVRHIADETASDAVADRVLEYVRNNLNPVDDREKLRNDVAAAWFDPANEAGTDSAGPDDPIIWVQDSFLVDQLETAGKNVEYKGQLVKYLLARGDLYGPGERRRWIDGDRTQIYPFDPDVLGMTTDDLGGDDPAHSEVSV